jgi:predicted nucleotidyltransferase
MATREDRWNEFKQRAGAENEFDRTSALLHAVTYVELALKAVGVGKKNEPVKVRIKKLYSLQSVKGLPMQEKLEQVIDIRNIVAHEHKVPSPQVVKECVSILHKAWHCMRRNFVSRNNAAKLAKTILDSSYISNVFLFGSLTRTSRCRDPRDIDLLLFDAGQFSFYKFGYGDIPPIVTDLLISKTALGSEANMAAIKCRWIQLIFVDGNRFGVDKQYTLDWAKNHHDPIFCLNLSDGLQKFDPTSEKWVKDVPQVFERLARLRLQLETENILAPQSK